MSVRGMHEKLDWAQLGSRSISSKGWNATARASKPLGETMMAILSSMLDLTAFVLMC